MNLDVGDVFHEMLPEPEYGISWAPWREGKDFTFFVEKPKRLVGWEKALNQYGPLIVSGELGEASLALGFERLGWSAESIPTWTPEFFTKTRYVGHFILIVGVDLKSSKLICLDPLKAEKGQIRYSFDWIQPRIRTVYAVHPASVRQAAERRSAQLQARRQAEDRRRANAQTRIHPLMPEALQDKLWNDML